MSEISPISALLVTSASPTPIRGKILKVSSLGLLVQITQTMPWQTGDRLQIQFDLPQTTVSYDEPVKVVKAYLKWHQPPDGGEKTKLQIFEMHFLGLAAQKKSVIDQFVAANKTGDKSGS